MVFKSVLWTVQCHKLPKLLVELEAVAILSRRCHLTQGRRGHDRETLDFSYNVRKEPAINHGCPCSGWVVAEWRLGGGRVMAGWWLGGVLNKG